MKLRYEWIVQCLCIGLLCLAAGLVPGCTHPELSRRYHDATWKPAKQDYVKLSLFTMNVPAETSKTLLSQLSANGQAALIYELGKRKKDKAEFLDALAAPEESQGKEKNKTIFKKRLVFSVSKIFGEWGEKSNVGLADRISDLTVTMTQVDDNQDAVFTSCDKFETAYETVDLAKVTLTKAVEASVQATISPGALASVAPSVTASRTLEEEENLKKRRIKLSVTIDAPEKTDVSTIHDDPTKLAKKRAILYQEGERGIDLTGTFIVDFKIDVAYPGTGKRIELLQLGDLVKNGKLVNPSDVEVNFSYLSTPPSAEPVKCNVGYNYTLRHVSNKAREMSEGNHDVDLLKGTASLGKVTLVDTDELQTVLFSIRRRDSTRDLALVDPLEQGEPGIFFDKLGKAREFLHWLKKVKSNKVGNYKLKLGGDELRPKDYENLYVKIVKRPMTQKEKYDE